MLSVPSNFFFGKDTLMSKILLFIVLRKTASKAIKENVKCVIWCFDIIKSIILFKLQFSYNLIWFNGTFLYLLLCNLSSEVNAKCYFKAAKHLNIPLPLPNQNDANQGHSHLQKAVWEENDCFRTFEDNALNPSLSFLRVMNE